MPCFFLFLLTQTNWLESTAPTAWTAPATWSAGAPAHSWTHPELSVCDLCLTAVCLNRRYLIDVDGMEPKEAVRREFKTYCLPLNLPGFLFKSRQMWSVFSVFNVARGHNIERQNYLKDLHCGPKRRWCTKTMLLSNIHVCMQILLRNLLRNCLYIEWAGL